MDSTQKMVEESRALQKLSEPVEMAETVELIISEMEEVAEGTLE